MPSRMQIRNPAEIGEFAALMQVRGRELAYQLREVRLQHTYFLCWDLCHRITKPCCCLLLYTISHSFCGDSHSLLSGPLTSSSMASPLFLHKYCIRTTLWVQTGLMLSDKPSKIFMFFPNFYFPVIIALCTIARNNAEILCILWLLSLSCNIYVNLVRVS